MALGVNVGGVTGFVNPDRNLRKQTKPRVLRVSFGDGYEQRLRDGINNLNQSFNISFNNRSKQEIDDIVDFLDAQGGVTAFDFTFPDPDGPGGETTVKVVCEDYGQTFVNTDINSCSATFRRVYEA
jgi:phage-related protein